MTLTKIKNVTTAKEELEYNEITYTAHNSDTHFMLWFEGKHEIDFWPTTGKFFYRAENIKGKGLDMLFETINKYIYGLEK